MKKYLNFIKTFFDCLSLCYKMYYSQTEEDFNNFRKAVSKLHLKD